MPRLPLLCLLCACAAAPSVTEEPRDVSFTPLAPLVHRYEVRTNDKREVLHANGLLIGTPEGAVLVDTGWRDDQAEQLIAFTEQQYRRPPVLAIVTHAHADRSGGLAALRRRGIRVAWSRRTAELVAQPRPDDLVFDETATFSTLELYFPGAGHAPDNIVVWHAPSKTLYGGCFIKATEQRIGWTKDADLSEWPRSLERTAARYPDAKTVVPGHGNPGGLELLQHTTALIAAQ